MMYLDLFLTFLKIGAFTFGGGYAMLPMIQQEIEAHGWLTNEQLVDFIAVSESTPGPFAINVSTYVGMNVGGWLGGFCATFGVVLPSFIIILAVAKFYDKFKNSTVVSGAMTGLKPAVVGLIGAAAVSVGMTVLFPNGAALTRFEDVDLYITIAIAVLSVVLAFKKIHPIIIIVLSAVIGIAAGYALGL